MELSVLLLFCLFICSLIFVCGDAHVKESASGWGGGGGRGSLGVLTRALGDNCPLVLVYPIDMPVIVVCLECWWWCTCGADGGVFVVLVVV